MDRAQRVLMASAPLQAEPVPRRPSLRKLMFGDSGWFLVMDGLNALGKRLLYGERHLVSKHNRIQISNDIV